MERTKKIRILLLITSTDFGGAETLFLQQVSSLNKDRFEPLVCSIKPAGAIAAKIQSYGVPVKSLDLDMLSCMFQPRKIMAAFQSLSRLIKDFKPDILHTSLFQADVLGAFCGAWSGVPVRVATVHMVIRGKFWQLFLERALAPLVSCYIAVSDDIRRFYTSRLFLPASKIKTIYNAVDEDSINKKAVSEPDILKSVNRPFIAMVGRLDPQKDLDNLLKAMKIVVHRRKEAYLILVGKGPERDRLERKIKTMELENNVTLAGYQENPMALIARSRALVLSSKEEGLPMVILEAMALSKPVISTSVGAIPEAVQDGISGWLVPAHDSEKLAGAIEKIFADENEAAEMGRKGRALLREKFSTALLGRALEDVYESLL